MKFFDEAERATNSEDGTRQQVSLQMLSNSVVLALILVLITSSFLLILQRSTGKLAINAKSGSKNREPTLIIAGPSNSGKTCLYNLLTTGKIKTTVTSQEPNVAHNFKLSKVSKVRLMEFPGHLKLRNKLLDEIRTSVNIKGLIFVIDATVDPKQLTKTAEFLFQILQLTERQKNGVDILLACNKSEMFTARPSLKIRDVLEREIEKIIVRKQKSLDTVTGPIGGHAQSNKNLGDDEVDSEDAVDFETGSGFSFDVLEGNLDAFEGSVLKRDIEKWECWIEERVVN